MRIPPELEDAFSFYTSRGLGSRVGFGQRPAVLVVDLVNGFTDPASPLGCDLTRPIRSTVRVLDAARARGVPIVFSTVGYDANVIGSSPWMRKIPANRDLVLGSPLVEVDDRLGKRDDEQLLVKEYASCFFGTDLATRFVAAGVDTVIITGATTSGCVRASAVDACSHGFRTIVVEEAVGDRADLPHYVNLFDIDAKYADVVSEDDVVAFLE